jgi:long-chain fatty acid transport protein
MNKMTHAKFVLTGALGLISNYATAAGFQLLEQNASGIGNAYAGSAAVAENASTIFYNPAGMTQLREREATMGLSAIKTSFKFTDNGSSVGALTGTGVGGDAGNWGFVPNGYVSWATSPDLYFGVGVGAPFGLKTEYNAPWVGSAQANSFDIKTYNINPSVAYRVSPALSIGGGLNWQRITAEYLRASAVANAPLAASPLTLGLSGTSWGWNAGALFTVSPETKVGVSYRSSVSYDLTGNINITGAAAANSSGAKASLKLPDVFILSGTHQVSDKWQLLGDVSWTGWSSIPKIDVFRTTGPATGAIAQTLDTEFRDSWRVAVGANYQLRPDMKLKMGVAYDQTPVKGATTRLVSLPDNDRTWLSFGAQWMPNKDSTLDIGITHLLVNDPSIDNNQLAFSRGRVTGSYSANVWILGVQYSFAF